MRPMTGNPGVQPLVDVAVQAFQEGLDQLGLVLRAELPARLDRRLQITALILHPLRPR
jgi:hypothetical protein